MKYFEGALGHGLNGSPLALAEWIEIRWYLIMASLYSGLRQQYQSGLSYTRSHEHLSFVDVSASAGSVHLKS